MNGRVGDDMFDEEANATEKDTTNVPQINEEDLDRVSGGGNSAWGTIQQGGQPQSPAP
jgi:hypothetical protein